MKSTFSALLLILLFTCCSKVEIAEDPILGIWTHELQVPMEAEGIEIDAQEWIFNDLYKGRFHGYKDGEIVYDMDYTWTIDSNQYTLVYNGGDLEEIDFKRQNGLLIDMEGQVIASKAK